MSPTFAEVRSNQAQHELYVVCDRHLTAVTGRTESHLRSAERRQLLVRGLYA